MTIKIEEGKIYKGIDMSGYLSQLRKKTEGRKVLIERIYTRLGASERSFVCVFLPNNSRQKEYRHTFNEFEGLAKKIIVD